MLYHVTIGERTLAVEVDGDRVSVDGADVSADLARLPGTAVRHLVLDGSSHRFACRSGRPGSWEILWRGGRVDAEVVDERTRAIRALTGHGEEGGGPEPVRAPMPGLVVRIEVAEGQEVRPGDGLAIVEAMKMENELRADAPGRIRTIRVSEGQAVDKDQVLIEIEASMTDGK